MGHERMTIEIPKEVIGDTYMSSMPGMIENNQETGSDCEIED
jgi:hypothetical protein